MARRKGEQNVMESGIVWQLGYQVRIHMQLYGATSGRPEQRREAIRERTNGTCSRVIESAWDFKGQMLPEVISRKNNLNILWD